MDHETGGSRDTGQSHDDFASLAEQRRTPFLAEFWRFARHNKRWWMTPIVVILLLLGLLVLAGGSGAGPLIYPLF